MLIAPSGYHRVTYKALRNLAGAANSLQFNERLKGTKLPIEILGPHVESRCSLRIKHPPDKSVKELNSAIGVTTMPEGPLRIATAEDLETYKPIIERLFVNEMKTLHQVTDFMVQDSGLKPTYALLLAQSSSIILTGI